MFRQDIIEKIIEDRGDIAVYIKVQPNVYSDGEYNNYEPIALYRLDFDGDNPFKSIDKKEYQSYIRDEQINKILE